MAGPWEKYATQEDGPWKKYQPAAEPEGGGFLDRAVDDLKQVPGRVGNLAAGAFRGAGSIGATIMAPKDIISDALEGKGLTLESNRRRRADMDATLQELGADPSSRQFQAGKLGAEVAGSLGAGGLVAKGVSPLAPVLANAIRSGGFNAPGANMLTRIAGGAISGGATAGLVDPKYAPAGFAIGGILPPATKAAGYAGNALSEGMDWASRKLMQSAIKPTIKQLQTGDAATAVDVLLERGINPNQAGVNKLRGLIDDLNSQIASKVSNSTAKVNKGNVIDRAWSSRGRFTNQVDPEGDLNAIDGVFERFYLNPRVPADMPVQAAQDLKQGTYRVLAKKYGQMGSAETEAQKALARGLKEEIADAVPEVAGLNAQESKLITTLNVAERRALMELNKNPVGLAALAQSPASWAAFMADRSALFKSLAARMLNASSVAPTGSAGLLENSVRNPLMRNALVRPLATSEGSP